MQVSRGARQITIWFSSAVYLPLLGLHGVVAIAYGTQRCNLGLTHLKRGGRRGLNPQHPEHQSGALPA